MADFSQFNVQGRSLSDITPVQSPVVDTSKASEIAAVTQGVASLANIGFNLYQQDQQQQKAEAQAFQTKSFEEDLLKAKDLADQEGAESTKFKTFLTQKFRASQLDYDTKTKMMKDFQATALGKVFTEVSPETEARDAAIKAAYAARFWIDGDSEEDIMKGVMQYQKRNRDAELRAAQTEELALQRAQVGLSKEQRAEVDAQIGQVQFDSMANLAANERPAVKKRIDSIVRGFQTGAIDRKTAEMQLKQAKGDLNAQIAQLTRNVDRAKVDPLANPLISLYDTAIDNIDSKNLLAEIENQNNLVIAQTKRNTFLKSPDMISLVAASSLTKHNNPGLAAQITEKTAEMLKQNSVSTGKPGDITDDSKDTQTYLEILNDSIDKVDMVDAGNQPLINKEELLTNINNVLSGSARYISPEDVPQNNEKILKWLASEKLGPFIKDNLSLLNQQSRNQLTDTLEKSAVNFIYPAFESTVESELRTTGKRFGVSEEDVNLESAGNRVRFTTSSPDSWTKSVVNKMNNELAGALTTYWNAVGNVSGDGFSTTFDRERKLLWPSKYGESPEQDVEEVDYTQFENGDYQDEEGNIFTIRNGILTETRRADDVTASR